MKKRKQMKKSYLALIAICIISVLGNVFLYSKLKNAEREVEIRQKNADKIYTGHLAKIEDLLSRFLSEERNKEAYLAELMAYCVIANDEKFYTSYEGDLAVNTITELSSYLLELSKNEAAWQYALENDIPRQMATLLYHARAGIKEGKDADEAFSELWKYMRTLSGQTTPEVLESFTGYLTHDGELWTVRTEAECRNDRSDPEAYYVRVYNEAGEMLWQSERVDDRGHDRYFLVSRADGDSLLRYRPDPATGTPVYDFELFHLKQNGQKVVDDKDMVEFTSEPSTTWNEEIMYPAEKMESFAEKLNGYLENGFLLLGMSESCRIEYSTGDDRITFQETYGSLFTRTDGISPTDDIAANIEAYKGFLLEEKQKMIESRGRKK